MSLEDDIQKAQEPAPRAEATAPSAAGDAADGAVEVPPTEPAADTSADAMQQELELLQAREAESRDALLRARAEIENLHKRQQRELENAARYALDGFLRELLPVLDSLELGCRSASAEPEDIDAESLQEGLQLTIKLLRDRMQKAGVEVIDPVDAPFDPEAHEAVSTQGNAQGTLRVVSVLQKGYSLHGRLLRPARVVVATQE